jgi:hypothetical protein
MNQSVQWLDTSESEALAIPASKRLSFLRFLLRYPMFLLAFGPPQFKTAVTGIDTSQAHFDLWNVLQVGWLFAIALRAMLRLANVKTILIPKQIRSIIKLPFFLGLLFVASIIYSPGRAISAEYCVIFFLNFVVMFEFIVDVYRNPPDWMQCIFALRFVSIVLFFMVLMCLPVVPGFVMIGGGGVGIRLLGGSVAQVTVICPIMAISSAYFFLHSLESRLKSVFFFLMGFAGTMATQTRGTEIGLFLILAGLAIGRARMSKQAAYIFIAASMAFVLLFIAAAGVVGADRIWKAFNRGQDISNVETASGRTGVWEDLIGYCLTNPEGMGYIAGMRATHRRDFATNLHASLTNIGGTDNSYMETLADAGWLALGVYLTMLVKTIRLGLRLAKKSVIETITTDNAIWHATRCALLLLAFCLIDGMENSDFVLPLRQEFYIQNILLAMILGMSANVLIASRARNTSLFQ